MLFEDPLGDPDQSAQIFENCFSCDFDVSSSPLQTRVDASTTLILQNPLSAETKNIIDNSKKLVSSESTQKVKESAKSKKKRKDDGTSQVLFSSDEIDKMFNCQRKPKSAIITHSESLEPKPQESSSQLSFPPNIYIFNSNLNVSFHSEKNELTQEKSVDTLPHHPNKSPKLQIPPKRLFNAHASKCKSDANQVRISSPELEIDSDTKSPNESPPEPQSASNSPKILFLPIKVSSNNNDANPSVWLDATRPYSINSPNAQPITSIKHIANNVINNPNTSISSEQDVNSSTISLQNVIFPRLNAQNSPTAVKDFISSYTRPNATITRLKISTADQYFLDSLAPDEAAKDPKIWDQTKTK
jgi:hypothetical protein